eukprot:768759-Hanusia_phi.AAC.18
MSPYPTHQRKLFPKLTGSLTGESAPTLFERSSASPGQVITRGEGQVATDSEFKSYYMVIIASSSLIIECSAGPAARPRWPRVTVTTPATAEPSIQVTVCHGLFLFFSRSTVARLRQTVPAQSHWPRLILPGTSPKLSELPAPGPVISDS